MLVKLPRSPSYHGCGGARTRSASVLQNDTGQCAGERPPGWHCADNTELCTVLQRSCRYSLCLFKTVALDPAARAEIPSAPTVVNMSRPNAAAGKQSFPCWQPCSRSPA
ncbi:unnamed protein product [Lota lota]